MCRLAEKIFENGKEGKGFLIDSQIKTKIQKQKKDKITAVSETKGRIQEVRYPFWKGCLPMLSGEGDKACGKGTTTKLRMV